MFLLYILWTVSRTNGLSVVYIKYIKGWRWESLGVNKVYLFLSTSSLKRPSQVLRLLYTCPEIPVYSKLLDLPHHEIHVTSLPGLSSLGLLDWRIEPLLLPDDTLSTKISKTNISYRHDDFLCCLLNPLYDQKLTVLFLIEGVFTNKKVG